MLMWWFSLNQLQQTILVIKMTQIAAKNDGVDRKTYRGQSPGMVANWIECLVKINLSSKEMTHRQWNAR